MKKSLVFVLSVGMLSLAACGNNSFEVVKFDVDNAVHANESAKTLGEWDESDSNPENLFPKWRQQVAAREITTADICSSLNTMDADKLALFENEIDDEANLDLVSDCREELQAKLDNYYLNERKEMTANLGNFFEDEAKTAVKENTPSDVKTGGLVNSTPTSGFRFNTVERIIDTSNGFQATKKEDRKKAGLQPKEVILTFDDGPSPYTTTILKTLEKVGAKAMFFQVGKNVQIRKNQDLVRLVAQGGHVVGGHTMTHANLRNLSRSKADKEIFGSLNAIQAVLGWVHPVFRFPYGNSTTALQQDLRNNKIGEFYWDVDSEDWKGRSPARTIEFTMKQVRARGGGVVLFHDIQKHTMELLPEFLRILHKEGYKIAVLKPNSLIRSPISVGVPNKP